MSLFNEIAIFQTVKSKVIISVFAIENATVIETIKLSVSILPRIVEKYTRKKFSTHRKHRVGYQYHFQKREYCLEGPLNPKQPTNQFRKERFNFLKRRK